MKLYDENGNEYEAVSVGNNRPQFRDTNGRVWDYILDKTINDEQIKMMYESSYGYNFYFCFQDKWYRIQIFGLRTKKGKMIKGIRYVNSLYTKYYYNNKIRRNRDYHDYNI